MGIGMPSGKFAGFCFCLIWTNFRLRGDSFVETAAWMCIRCGAITWFGDTVKLAKLRIQVQPKEAGETAIPLEALEEAKS